MENASIIGYCGTQIITCSIIPFQPSSSKFYDLSSIDKYLVFYGFNFNPLVLLLY